MGKKLGFEPSRALPRTLSHQQLTVVQSSIDVRIVRYTYRLYNACTMVYIYIPYDIPTYKN